MSIEDAQADRAEAPLVEVASVDEVLDAIDAFDLDASWGEVAPRLRLVLPRRRPMPADIGTLPWRSIGPGVRATLGLDLGPALLFLSRERLEAWSVSVDDAFDLAVETVRQQVAARRHFGLISEEIAGVPTLAFQSREGWASSLLAVPEAVPTVLGRQDGLVLVPMRDLILALPADAEHALADWILEAFAEADMNALDVPLLRLSDGHLSVERPWVEERMASPVLH